MQTNLLVLYLFTSFPTVLFKILRCLSTFSIVPQLYACRFIYWKNQPNDAGVSLVVGLPVLLLERTFFILKPFQV